MAVIIKLSQNRNYCSSSCLLLPRSSKFTDLQFIFLCKLDLSCQLLRISFIKHLHNKIYTILIQSMDSGRLGVDGLLVQHRVARGLRPDKELARTRRQPTEGKDAVQRVRRPRHAILNTAQVQWKKSITPVTSNNTKIAIN